MWIFFGLIAALYVNRDKMAGQFPGEKAGDVIEKNNNLDSGDNEHKVDGRQVIRRLGTFLLAFAYWVVLSLLAIAFVGNWPYLGLILALVGGVLLGFICIESFEFKFQKKSQSEISQRNTYTDG